LKILLAIIITASFIALISSLTFLLVVQDSKRIEMQLKVDNYLGFNVDTDKLYFGVIPQGNTGTRRVVIENKNYEKSVVRIKLNGDLKDWIIVSENNFALKRGEAKEVKVEVTVPSDAKKGEYTGGMTIFFTRI